MVYTLYLWNTTKIQVASSRLLAWKCLGLTFSLPSNQEFNKLATQKPPKRTTQVFESQPTKINFEKKIRKNCFIRVQAFILGTNSLNLPAQHRTERLPRSKQDEPFLFVAFQQSILTPQGQFQWSYSLGLALLLLKQLSLLYINIYRKLGNGRWIIWKRMS